MVETADVVFALDSIPAIFGITTDPFIVFTSNVCAVMGLRAMFFLLRGRHRPLPPASSTASAWSSASSASRCCSATGFGSVTSPAIPHPGRHGRSAWSRA
jgi:hypothetical protein